ncbi:HAMP domain-containing sensor histidine kinase [Actinophytocola sp.]|uniref:sensor histidine kinase n=1 Tax=Actinophytocola sp. TaxID=1872138 RepID=UPI002ED4107F
MRSLSSRLWGRGAESAARQASLLFTVAGLVTVASTLSFPDRAVPLGVLAVLDGAIAVVAWRLPWRRWGRRRVLLLSLPALGVLGSATWATGGVAIGTAPLFMLLFVWLGLNFSPTVVVVVAVPGCVAYVVPLLAAGQPDPVVGSVFVMMPALVGIGLLIAYQVSHQEHVTLRLRVATAQLHHDRQWRAALVSTVARDVRCPLAAAQLALDSLRDELPRERQDAALTAARRQVERVRGLATSLLDERVDTLRLDRREVRLAHQMDEVLTYLGGAAADVQVDIDPALTVTADQDRLEQILVNLVANAFTHAGPPVRVSAERRADVVRVEVRDFGPGVPQELLPRLFTRFSDGLSIARELARAHGGDVHYEPWELGACFVLSLPLTARPLSTEDGIVPEQGQRGRRPAAQDARFRARRA